MNKKVTSGLLVALACTSVQADYLNGREIKKQFSDYTVTMVELNKARVVTLHYASDGVLTGLRGTKEINSSWEIDSKDRLCMDYGKKVQCSNVARREGRLELVRVKKNGQEKLIAEIDGFSKGK